MLTWWKCLLQMKFSHGPFIIIYFRLLAGQQMNQQARNGKIIQQWGYYLCGWYIKIFPPYLNTLSFSSNTLMVTMQSFFKAFGAFYLPHKMPMWNKSSAKIINQTKIAVTDYTKWSPIHITFRWIGRIFRKWVVCSFYGTFPDLVCTLCLSD